MTTQFSGFPQEALQFLSDLTCMTSTGLAQKCLKVLRPASRNAPILRRSGTHPDRGYSGCALWGVRIKSIYFNTIDLALIYLKSRI